MLVATLGGPTMFARIGIARALNRHVELAFNPDRKEHHWGRRRLKRISATMQNYRHSRRRPSKAV